MFRLVATPSINRQDVLEVRQYEPPLDAIQQAWDAAGKEYPVSAEEGTLYPFDRSSMSGWCGEDSAGDRVTFIMFDMRDFNEDALGKVELRMTPESFPSIAKVEVRGYCDTNWHEQSLTYVTAPHLDNTATICTWSGDEEIKYYDEPLTCDVTAVAKEKAGDYLCLSIDMVRKTTNSREPVVFWARELDEHSERTIAVTNFDELMGKATPLRGAAQQYGTVPGSTDKASWKPHLMIEGSGKGTYPDHSAEDLP